MLRIPHLETDVTTACQLSCVACNHHVPLYRHARTEHLHATPDVLERDLGHLATIMHADRWAAIGGEPLLHHRLVDLLRAARASGVADELEVWTNGLLLRRQGPGFWKAFDWLVLSVYPGRLSDEDVAWTEARCRDAGVKLRVVDERRSPNFKTLLEPVPTGTGATRKKFQGCFFRHYSRAANNGWFFTCCCATHMPVLVQGRPFGSDGVRIEGLTEIGLRAYLEREEPLQACSICAGRDTARSIPWREERDPVRWLRRSAGTWHGDE